MKQITVLKGDGIGPEIMDSALDILEAASHRTAFDYQLTFMPFGGAAIDEKGLPLPEETRVAAQSADAILLGAIGGPKWQDSKETPEEGLLVLRQALALYANLRPTKVNADLVYLSPLKPEIVRGTDFIIVRELIGGLYFGEPKHYDDTEAIDTMYYTRENIERIVRLAFDLAQSRRGKVTSIDKANVLANSKLWRKIVGEISQDYPEVQLDHMYVDAAAMNLITHPTQFDVIVTENLFGDILSDEASVMTGSLGLLPSASVSETGPSLYEPIHGSAPDIAGLNKANPMSMILSVTMMLRESFAETEIADRIEAACSQVMQQGILTGDLGGTATTTEFATAVIDQLKK